MTDVAETTEAAVEATTLASPEAPESYINPDGTFKEGWIDAYVPEDFRQKPVYKTFTDVKGMMKQLGHQASLIGQQGKGIMPLPKDATPTERDLYFKALGRPATPADYTVEVPKGMEAYYADPMLADARTALHEAGLTQGQLNAVLALDAKRVAASVAHQETAAAEATQAAEAALRTKWGNAYDERLHMANRMISENVPEDRREAILAQIGNNPDVADFLATIGKKFMEGTVANPDGGSASALTPAECENRARELMATPGYVQGTLPQATRERIGREINALYRAATPKS